MLSTGLLVGFLYQLMQNFDVVQSDLHCAIVFTEMLNANGQRPLYPSDNLSVCAGYICTQAEPIRSLDCSVGRSILCAHPTLTVMSSRP